MFKAQDARCTRQWSSDAFWKESDHRWWTDLCSIYIESAIKNLYSAIGLCTKLCLTFIEHVFWNLPSLYRQSFSVWISFTRTAFFILAMMWFYRLTWPIPDKLYTLSQNHRKRLFLWIDQSVNMVPSPMSELGEGLTIRLDPLISSLEIFWQKSLSLVWF